MFKVNRGPHYARELEQARLRGVSFGPPHSHAHNANALVDVIRKFTKHNPSLTVTSQLASLEFELHKHIAAFFDAVGYSDASHSNDKPGAVLLPPVMEPGLSVTADVQRIVKELELLAPATSDSRPNATTCVALCELGQFLLGRNSTVVELVQHTQLLETDPFSSPLNEHHIAVTIMGICVHGMYCRLACTFLCILFTSPIPLFSTSVILMPIFVSVAIDPTRDSLAPLPQSSHPSRLDPSHSPPSCPILSLTHRYGE